MVKVTENIPINSFSVLKSWSDQLFESICKGCIVDRFGGLVLKLEHSCNLVNTQAFSSLNNKFELRQFSPYWEFQINGISESLLNDDLSAGNKSQLYGLKFQKFEFTGNLIIQFENNCRIVIFTDLNKQAEEDILDIFVNEVHRYTFNP